MKQDTQCPTKYICTQQQICKHDVKGHDKIQKANSNDVQLRYIDLGMAFAALSQDDLNPFLQYNQISLPINSSNWQKFSVGDFCMKCI